MRTALRLGPQRFSAGASADLFWPVDTGCRVPGQPGALVMGPRSARMAHAIADAVQFALDPAGAEPRRAGRDRKKNELRHETLPSRTQNR